MGIPQPPPFIWPSPPRTSTLYMLAPELQPTSPNVNPINGTALHMKRASRRELVVAVVPTPPPRPGGGRGSRPRTGPHMPAPGSRGHPRTSTLRMPDEISKFLSDRMSIWLSDKRSECIRCIHVRIYFK